MKQNSFWGNARSKGMNVGLIVRLGLALAALAGSVTLAWTLLSTHGAHAAGVNTTGTTANPWGIIYDSSGNAWVAEPNCNPNPVCTSQSNGAIEEFKLSGGQPTLVNTYQAPRAGSIHPTFMQLDGAGNAWFTDPTSSSIGEVILSTNTWTEIPTPTANSEPVGLIIDTNGNIWFTERGANQIGFYSPSTKTFKETPVKTANSQPYGLAYDSAHNTIWFDEDAAANIGNFTVTTTGIITVNEIAINNNPHLIRLDSAGNLWFSEQGAASIGEYNTSTKKTTVYNLQGSICPTPGVIPTPTTCTNTYIGGIAIDSSGTVWFDETQTAVIGSLNPTTSAVNIFHLNNGSNPGDGLNADSQGNIWVSLFSNLQIGVLPAGSAPTPTPSVTSGSPSPTTTATSTTTVTPTPTGTPPPNLQPGPVNKTWYFAEGRVGAGFTEYLSMDNPTGNACTVDITYLYTPDRGTPLTKTVVVNIPANSRYEEGVDGDLGTYPTGPGVTDSAIVAVDTSSTGTPACTGIVAERPMYYNTQGNSLGANSTSDVLGVTHLGTSFYLADVATGAQAGGKFSSFITILNPPGGQLANVTAKYYANSATPGAPGTLIGSDPLQVPAGTRGTIFPGNHSPALPAHVSVIVTSDQPVAVERPTYFSNVSEGNAGTVSGGADVIGVQSLASDWLFAEGYTGNGFQESFVLANLDPANAAATVTIKLELSSGPITEPAITIQPDSQYIWNVNMAAPGQNISAEITSTGAKIVAQREMFFHYNHQGNGRSLQVMGGTDVLGQSGPAAQSLYSFAEGYVNTNYDEWLTLQNPTGTDETVWVTLYNALGHTYTFYVPVKANTRATVDIVAAVFFGLYHNGDGFRGLEVAMTVQTTSTAGGPFVAERPMYSNVNGIQGGTDIIGYVGG